jgi:hypothetical protein
VIFRKHPWLNFITGVLPRDTWKLSGTPDFKGTGDVNVGGLAFAVDDSTATFYHSDGSSLPFVQVLNLNFAAFHYSFC